MAIKDAKVTQINDKIKIVYENEKGSIGTIAITTDTGGAPLSNEEIIDAIKIAR